MIKQPNGIGNIFKNTITKGLFMATSKCSSCGSHSFEMVTNEPHNSNYKYNFIQCSGCGAVIGVTEFFNIGQILNEHEEIIKKIQDQLNYISSMVYNMQH